MAAKKKAVTIKKPKPKKKVAKVAAVSKANPNEIKPLQFKVPTDFHREFKAEAVERGLSMQDMFYEMYDHYLGR